MSIHDHISPDRDQLEAPLPTAAPSLRWHIDRSVLAVTGEVDALTCDAFGTSLAVCNGDPTVAALDLSNVSFFSAAGVRCFIEHGWTSRAHPMIIASPVVRRVLGACGMEFLLD